MLTSGSVAAAPRAMGINLVLFFVFALGALVLLTQTLVSITQVEAGVRDSVQPATSGIVDNTALLQKLTVTNKMAVRLLAAGNGVNGSLTDVALTTRQIEIRLAEVRDGTARIDRSVAGIAMSSADVRRLVSGLDTSVGFTDSTSALISSALAGADRAVQALPNTLNNALGDLSALLGQVPRISQQAAGMSPPLARVDGHLANVYANGLVKLANLLPLHGLLSGVVAGGGRP